MNKVFLFARSFPYGKGEPYIKKELDYLARFDEVHLFSLSVVRGTERISLKEYPNIYFHTIYFSNKIVYILMLYSILFDGDFYREVGKLIREKKFNFSTLYELAIFMIRGKKERRQVKRIIERKGLLNDSDKAIFYSYRFDYTSYVSSTIFPKRDNSYRIVRAHGRDLYEDRNKDNYLPMREYILNRIDDLCLISKSGVEYMIKNYPEYKRKYILYYLGTEDVGYKPYNKSEDLRILSISNMNDVKRIDRIISSLSLASEICNIDWTHYGSGNLYGQIKEVADKERSNEFSIDLKGHVENAIMMKELSESEYDFFINLSSSEGLPVSIMEAMSQGIPVLATDVGGTSEIVEDGYNGFLLSEDFRDEDVVDIIKIIKSLNDKEYLSLRKNARKTWEDNFSADKNYSNFVNFMMEKIKG